jgi:hypothetical protein
MNKPIYPGDKKILMSVDYFMDTELYWQEDTIFKMIVRATFYADGSLPIVVEKAISELQIF